MTPEEKEKDYLFKKAVIGFAEGLLAAMAWTVPPAVRDGLREPIQTMRETLK